MFAESGGVGEAQVRGSGMLASSQELVSEAPINPGDHNEAVCRTTAKEAERGLTSWSGPYTVNKLSSVMHNCAL